MSESSGRKPETHTEAFSEIYARERWGKGKGSGTGSSPEYCKKYMAHIQRLVNSGEYQQVIDFGSGDWQFSRFIDWSPVDYLGVECVTSVFDRVQGQFQSTGTDERPWPVAFVNKDFSNANVVADILEAYRDKSCLILVKDVLQHWEDRDVYNFLYTVFNSAKRLDTLLVTNNWRYIRAPKPIPDPRVLDKYRWCPIDLLSPKWSQFEFELELYYPRKEKQVVRRVF